MAEHGTTTVEWVVLTQGDRPDATTAAIDSLGEARVCLLINGGVGNLPLTMGRRELVEPQNVGVPAGRDIGARSSTADVIAFLDDDALASPDLTEAISAAFVDDEQLGAIALRLVDEAGRTARRHVPRLGGRDAECGGDVALFLGGACAIRRDAYDDAGGYWGELFYGHEEVELAWRLIDRDWTIRYRPDLTVYHPRTEIGRHAEGWRMTGRNRVMIARRTLPWPVAIVHVVLWLVLGVFRAPSEHRRSYLIGWRAGWRHPVEHRPIRWKTVWRLTRLGRPPIL